MKLKLISLSIFLSTLYFVGFSDQKAHWPDKHGPTLDGLVPAEASKIPLSWSESENVSWKTPYKGTGHSSPIILGDGIWFTSATEDGKEQYVYCVDRHSGKVIHEITLYKNEAPEELGNSINTYATPSCVAEAGAIYVHFGTYGTAKLDPKTAKVIWNRTDIKARHFRGPASSPVLYKDMLILTFDAIDQQFLMALDKHTGKTLWRTERSVDFQDLVDGKPKRDGDFRKAFGTPGFAKVNGKHQILSVGSRAAYGYDADTGKEIWIMEHSNYNAAVRPIFVPEYNMALLNTGSGKAIMHGIKLDTSTQKNINDTHVKWSQRYASSYCLPIYHEGHVYQIKQRGKVTCTNLKTGEETWEQTIRHSYMASPILFDKKILMISDKGVAIIFEANPKAYVQVSENHIDEGVSACPAVAENELFLRANKYLYKISNK